ncbi:MAG: hypothetical protein E7442_00595 [Ruminococcaceae bacterium]|nr:hypothetical protein [Oscillospiraceae bacterium]
MLMRWAGAVMLVSACAAVGLGRSRELRLRVANLRSLLLRLESFETEVSILATPLTEALKILCGCRVEADELRDRRFSEIWCREIGELGFPAAENEVLEELGLALSRGDEPGRVLPAAAERLRRILREAEADAEQKCRLCSSLGVCAGLLAAIVLI